MTPRTETAQLEGVNLLDLTPRRVARWSEDGDIVVLHREPPGPAWRRPLAWLGYKMSVKSLRLDEIGSFAWKRLDGRRTVAELVADLRQEFGEQVEPAEERFGQLVRMLHNGELIDYEELAASNAVTETPR